MRGNSATHDTTQATRQWLAFSIVGLSIVGIALIAILAIGYSSAETRGDTTTLVFTAVLPLLGTWVGTVLAFYFVRENLQAATESTLRLSGRLEGGTAVDKVMIPKAKITSYTLKPDEDPGLVTLHEIVALMESSGHRRIPLLAATGAATYVFHDSTIARFANGKSKDPSDPAAFTELVSELLADAELRSLVEAFGVVGSSAVLADARAAMRAAEGSNDVFVTTTGKRTDPVVGWLTNTDMAEEQ